MTRPTARTAKFTATIWPAGSVDQWGQEVPGIPYTVKCNYLEGGNRTATDASGVQFKPSLIIWYELTDSQPRPDETKQCYVAIGDQTMHSSYSDANAKLIRSNNLQPWKDNSQLPDVELAC